MRASTAFCYVILFAEYRPRPQSCKSYSNLSVMPPAACRLVVDTRNFCAVWGGYDLHFQTEQE